MDGTAHVNSIEAVRDFRAALIAFVHEAKDALATHDLELRRALAWLLDEQPKFWQQELRRLDDAVTQAKIELERRLNSRLPGGETPSCAEERKQLERARLRRQRGEDTAAAMRRHAQAAEREAEEYAGRARQFGDLLESDMPRALATLDRVLDSLDAYLATASGLPPRAAAAAGQPPLPPDDADKEQAP